ncbi:lantibiotic dehydratase [Dinghuibacter silviterrae]|uniref:Thiopeptide-type bacteriocin biosynthesis protein n=1 Tax=Dinghuibacter silviterrae TaxID=1539049 RepID=A0A4R8DSV9_9BACT|nr:lantibiotic dehydratase [Dinghuibacter silviterrae]TDX00487.1 thiopeptide-type bacteriocin biosynthesis protein [Dinghuibacter silviterrae]
MGRSFLTMLADYKFTSGLVVRAPRIPGWQRLDEATIRALATKAWFKEAVYAASPALYREMLKWLDGGRNDKMLTTLCKYVSRMNHRCTPFGLFSGCAYIGWGQGETSITLNGTTRKTRPDMSFLYKFGRTAAAELRDHLRFHVNSSAYVLGEEIRLMKHVYDRNGDRTYQLHAVERTEYLDSLMVQAKGDVGFRDLVSTLVSFGAEEEDAVSYVERLLEERVFVDELEPTVTGEGYFEHLITSIEKAGCGTSAIGRRLKELKPGLAAIDTPDIADNDRSLELSGLFEGFGLAHDEGRLFQVDLFFEGDNCLDSRLKAQLVDVLKVLNKLSLPSVGGGLLEFARRYRTRYEDREMPLSAVLDPDAGIGYPGIESKGAWPELHLEAPEKRRPDLGWGQVEEFLFSTLLEAQQHHAYSVILDETTVERLPDVGAALPLSLSVTFQVLDGIDGLLWVEGAGGSSAANLLARFCQGDDSINQLSEEITSAEVAAIGSTSVLAEIVHLPEDRTGNIQQHPTLRDYEIPYLGQPVVQEEGILPLDDLYISVSGEEVVLRSRKLGKRVLPRLTNAYNYAKTALPVFRFLCDLQGQGTQRSLGFSWGALASRFVFLPRVTWKGHVLSRATWQFKAKDYRTLLEGEDDTMERMTRWREEWKIPLSFLWLDGDNELLIEAENPLLVGIFLKMVRKHPSFKIAEYLRTGEGVVRAVDGTSYNGQFVASLVRHRGTDAAPGKKIFIEGVQRSFSVGSEWMYYKLYCGERSADMLLDKVVGPVWEELRAKGLVQRWFFIRYADPEFHLRVRFLLSRPESWGEAVQVVSSHFRPFEKEGFIWKTQMDTYNRELERYGAGTIQEAEEIFQISSDSMLNFLRRQTDVVPRWMWGVQVLDAMLGSFGWELVEKQGFALDKYNLMAKELDPQKAVRRETDKNYRVYAKEISEMLSLNDYITEEFSVKFGNVTDRLVAAKRDGRLEVPLQNLLGSFIHMHMNRLFVSENRVQEMVVYDLAHRYYTSKLARLKD